MSGGAGTKVIVVGIGSRVVQSELQVIASSRKYVIVVQDFHQLTSVEAQLINDSSAGNLFNLDKGTTYDNGS